MSRRSTWRPDGTYAKRNRCGKEPVCAQGYLLCGGSAGGEGGLEKSRTRGDEGVIPLEQ